MKKLFFFVAALCCGVAVLATDFRVDNLSYTIIDAENHYVALDTNYSPSGVKVLEIPSTVEFNSQTYTVTKLARYALQYGSLEEIVIPGSIDSLLKGACEYQRSLKKITFNEGLLFIGDQAFREIMQVDSLIFPNSLKKIDSFGFIIAENIKFVHFGENIESIGDIGGGSGVTTAPKVVEIDAVTPPALAYSCFQHGRATTIIKVPASEGQAVLKAYQAATNWKEFENIIEQTATPVTYYNVTTNVTNGAFGTVKVNGAVKTNGQKLLAQEDSEVVLEVVANVGKEVESVFLGENEIILTDGKFTLPALTQDTAFTVNFASTVYTVTIAEEGAGTVVTNKFYYDENCRFAVDLNSGYKDLVVVIDGVDQVDASFFINIKKNHTVVLRATKDMPSEAPVAKSARLTTWNAGGHIFVSADGIMSNVKVYDLQGRQMLNKTDNSSLYILDSNNLNGYIIRATMADGSVETIKGM